MGFSSLFQAKHAKKPDYFLISCFGLLLLFGLVMLASASASLGKAGYNDTYYYLKHQIFYGISLGIVGFFLASQIYYGAYKNRVFSVAFLLLTCGLLLLVFTPLGLKAGGATRWLNFGPLSFQPAELLKLSLVMYLASWLSRKDLRQKDIVSGLIPFLVVLCAVSVLLVLQHSTSPVAILLLVAIIMYFMSGAKIRYLAAIIGAAALALALVVLITPYRAQRVLTFLNPEADPTATGFQALQAKTAIGAGGLTGVGYGQSTVKNHLPEPIGDSIFAVIGEELGFVGVAVLIGLFAFLVIRMFILARASSDPFGKLLLIGFGSVIGIQTIVNIGAMSGVLPLTGTPLPFISYGGTNLAVFMTMMGIVVNISKYSSR